MKKPILIYGAILLALLSIVGWSFELPLLEETVGSYDLVFKGALIGAGIGSVIGFILAVKESSFILKFQSFASSALLFTLIFALVGHFTNRTLASDDSTVVYMNVKQITATWEDQGILRQELNTPPDGHYIFVETDDGTVRLFKEGSAAPEIGPSRTVPVKKREGFWGYPRYSISIEEQ